MTDSQREGVTSRHRERAKSRESVRVTVAMAEGDPELPHGNLDDVHKVRGPRGKWQKDREPDQKPGPGPGKEAIVTMFEAGAVGLLGAIAFQSILPVAALLGLPLMAFCLGGSVARIIRAASLSKNPFLARIWIVGGVVTIGTAVITAVSALSLFATIVAIPIFAAGAWWGWTDHTMFGLRKHYHKN